MPVVLRVLGKADLWLGAMAGAALLVVQQGLLAGQPTGEPLATRVVSWYTTNAGNVRLAAAITLPAGIVLALCLGWGVPRHAGQMDVVLRAVAAGLGLVAAGVVIAWAVTSLAVVNRVSTAPQDAPAALAEWQLSRALFQATAGVLAVVVAISSWALFAHEGARRLLGLAGIAVAALLVVPPVFDSGFLLLAWWTPITTLVLFGRAFMPPPPAPVAEPREEAPLVLMGRSTGWRVPKP